MIVDFGGGELPKDVIVQPNVPSERHRAKPGFDARRGGSRHYGEASRGYPDWGSLRRKLCSST
jgi:hypothetical protein